MKYAIISVIMVILLVALFASNVDAANTKLISKNAQKPINQVNKIANSPPITSDSMNSYGKKGDINKDGRINAFDIDPFRMVLEYPDFFKTNHPDMFWRSDINSDGKVNEKDVNLFVKLLVG